MLVRRVICRCFDVSTPAYTPDFLGNTESVLDWPDLFSVDYSLSDLLSPGFGNTHNDAPEPQDARLPIVPTLTAPYSDHARSLWHSQDAVSRSSRQDVSNMGLPCLKPQGPMTLELSQDDTQMLLKHIKDHCFPQLWSSLLGKKSPLETHLTAAVLTFANMTYLVPRQISHASFTNVLALLAISSKHLAAQIRNRDLDKSEHWNQYAESAYQKAKQHLDYSLNTEVSPKVAKYKDLIMAVSTIVSFSILYDRQSDARKYLIDAERLLLNQGLPKPHISRKIKLLHHTYTWNRVISESTYVLRDSGSANIPMATEPYALPDGKDLAERGTGGNNIERSVVPCVSLDDFLHLESYHQETDDSSRESGREMNHDIHLKQGRGMSESAFMMLYGVSETWLSLLSQTTRLANLIQALNHGSKEKTLTLHEHIERRKESLEHRICSFASTKPTTDLPVDLDHLSNAPSRESQRTARSHLVRALNFALGIFFYRRVYNVHPHILQDYINNVMHALQEFERRCDREKQGWPGSPWPAFMAGCEAMTKEKRDYFANWFERAFDQTGFTRLVTARKCMYQVWERQDRFVMGGDEMQRHWTWMDISKERNLYVLLS
ncbi:Arginine metabolism regulation protein II [Fusarium oxysporum f. sp. cubense]|uniref:Arginine metabolism regulation protein II n=1 Tax=Fusarium oxysporum f. sp. cubense TaxID=61366 RepID=A0A559KRC3_FUSOC|nr:Arginine metabolism regulation protein II [Fusarium oxysporum f. sp. cubense]